MATDNVLQLRDNHIPVGWTPERVQEQSELVRQEARRLLAQGIGIIDASFMAKAPIGKKWQERNITLRDVDEYFPAGVLRNLGVVLGESSHVKGRGYLHDLDIDDPVALRLVDHFVPATLEFGREGSKRSHRLYFLDKPLSIVHWTADEAHFTIEGKDHKKMLLELRGTGHQTIFPPSIHVSRERVRYDNPGSEITAVAVEELIVAASSAAAAAIIVQYWHKGMRNDLSMHLAGVLLRTWDVQRVLAFVKAVAEVAGDDEVEKRLATVRTTFTKQERGAQTTGFPSLADVIGQASAKRIAEYLRLTAQAAKKDAQKDTYFIEDGHLCRLYAKDTRHGPVESTMKLANCDLRIAEIVVEDDGGGDGKPQQLIRCVGGELLSPRKMTLPPIEVASSEFAGMGWLNRFDVMGSPIIVEPGRLIKDYLRHAIESMSADIRCTTIYTHTGFRKISGTWQYLSAAGAHGNSNVQVKIDDERYCLPRGMDVDERDAITASLDMLEVAHARVSAPLFLITYLSPLTTLLPKMPGFSSYFYGESGTRKTSVALIALLHFGKDFTDQNLPSFADTKASFEKVAYQRKDALTILDDYPPSKSKHAEYELERIAQDVIRSYGNRTARGRLNRDLEARQRYYPRGMAILTGEQLPSLGSTLARATIVEVGKDDVDLARLSALQDKKELLSYAMLSYVTWVAEHVPDIKRSFSETFDGNRRAYAGFFRHGRLAEQLAYYVFVARTVGRWVVEKKVLTADEWQFKEHCLELLMQQVLEGTDHRVSGEDPIRLFFDTLQSLINQGKCKLVSRDRTDSKGNGDLIGYYDSQYAYLQWPLVWSAFQESLKRQDEHFSLKKNTFIDMLQEKKYLVHANHAVRIGDEVKKVYVIPLQHLIP
jgi:hypothetical protein